MEIFAPSINQTAENNPLFLVHFYDLIYSDLITSSWEEDRFWTPSLNWLSEVSLKYKQIDEFFFKSGQKAYAYEEVDGVNFLIVSKLIEDDMSGILYIRSDDFAFGKALEIAKSLEYSKSGFDKEYASIANREISIVDDLGKDSQILEDDVSENVAEYISLEEFISGISFENAVGNTIGNKFFQFEIPDGFSLDEERSIFDNDERIYVVYRNPSSGEELNFGISGALISAEKDPLEYIFYQETDYRVYNHKEDTEGNYPEIRNFQTTNGFKGISWTDWWSYEELVLLVSDIQLNYQNGKIHELWYIDFSSNLSTEKMINIADTFKLIDESFLVQKKSSNPIKSLQATEKNIETFSLIKLASNWFQSDWLGAFCENPDSSWIYHTFMGWIYTGSIKASPENLWLYKQGLGWLWTSEESYPWLYSDKTKFWVYLNLNEDIKPKQYFDSFDDRFWPWNSFPDRSNVEIESKNIQKILTDTDKDHKSKADAIMSIIMQGL